MLCPDRCVGCGCLGWNLCECCKKYIEKAMVEKTECEEAVIPCLVAVGRKEPKLMKLVKRYKYESAKRIAEVLVELLEKALIRAKIELSEKIIIVPLPTIRKHIRERGFDHTLRLAEVLAARNGWKCHQLLVRAMNSVQVGMSAEKRQEQAKRAYELKFGAKIDQNATYILLDDVWTTGASMRAGAEILKAAGVCQLLGLVIVRGE